VALCLLRMGPSCPQQGVPRKHSPEQSQSLCPTVPVPEEVTFAEYTVPHHLWSHSSALARKQGLLSVTPQRLGPRPSEVTVWEAALAPCLPTVAIFGARQLSADTELGPTLQSCSDQFYPVPNSVVVTHIFPCLFIHLFIHSFVPQIFIDPSMEGQAHI
jgi:hypothetical protein